MTSAGWRGGRAWAPAPALGSGLCPPPSPREGVRCGLGEPAQSSDRKRVFSRPWLPPENVGSCGGGVGGTPGSPGFGQMLPAKCSLGKGQWRYENPS